MTDGEENARQLLDRALSQSTDFDKSAAQYTSVLAYAADWKNNYYGAAYSTRIRQSILDIRLAAHEMERVLDFEDAMAKLPGRRIPACPRNFTLDQIIEKLKAGETLNVDRRDAPELPELLDLEKMGKVRSQFVVIDEQSSVLRFTWAGERE